MYTHLSIFMMNTYRLCSATKYKCRKFVRANSEREFCSSSAFVNETTYFF